MQIMAVVGKPPSKAARHGDVWLHEEIQMFDPRDYDSRDRHDDSRDLSRGGRAPGDGRQRDSNDPCDVFMRDLDLPRGHDREHVYDRDRHYTLRESESRTLSTVGAFRVVSSRDLRGHDGRHGDPRSGDLRRLREQSLIRTIPMEGRKEGAVVLTERGRSLLESHRGDRHQEAPPGVLRRAKKPREMEHDAQIYSAY